MPVRREEGMTLAAPRFAIQWNAWTLIPLLLAGAVLLTPYTLSHNLLSLAFVLRHGFALVCHQQPDRCFWIFGAPIAVCARCLGIYLGAAIGLLVRTSRRIALQLLIVAAALNALDWLTEATGLHGNWLTMRFLLGVALGSAAGMLISSTVSATPTHSAAIS